LIPAGQPQIPNKQLSPFVTRVLTAAAFGITTAALVFIHPLTCAAAMAILAGLCCSEFYRLMRTGTDKRRPNETIGLILAVLYPVLYAMNGGMRSLFVLTAIVVVVLLVWYAFDLRASITDVAVTLFGALYTGLTLVFLVWIRDCVPGLWGGVLACLVIIAVWANDAFAYIFGSLLGKHKMAPRISPGKTWEGCGFGMLASIIIWVIIMFVPGSHINIWWALAGGILCGLATILGDLVESRIKRGTGHKDSGHALPGHGGFLDRCDSMFLVVICAAAILFFAQFQGVIALGFSLPF
jgi:phosphatidate cytidylyltransferase